MKNKIKVFSCILTIPIFLSECERVYESLQPAPEEHNSVDVTLKSERPTSLTYNQESGTV